MLLSCSDLMGIFFCFHFLLHHLLLLLFEHQWFVTWVEGGITTVVKRSGRMFPKALAMVSTGRIDYLMGC